jgi:hypothetical protein
MPGLGELPRPASWQPAFPGTRDASRACVTRYGQLARCHLSLDFLTQPGLRSRAMQNQSNLMSSFEFIAALMSIIIGLGVTNLLAGAGRAFYRRKENPLDEVHIVLTVATLLLLVLQWWVTFKWNTEVTWTFDKFLLLIAWTVAIYMLTVFLYPPDLSEEEEHQGRFERNRSGYYSTFIAMCLLDIAQTAVHGELLQPMWYLPFVGQYALLAGVGLIAGRRGYDRFFAWYQLVTLLVWALVVRRVLVGDTITS